jgi:hypothetical protein
MVLLASLMTAPPVYADEPADFLSLINDARAIEGLNPLLVYSDLVDDAQAHTEAMVAAQELYHNPNLSTVTSGWYALGENVGFGGSAETLHLAFMDSPPHRANILGDYNYVGIGSVQDGPLVWATIVFMRGPDGLAGDSPTETADEGLYEMYFPVLGENWYTDTWGACRGVDCSRSHEGTDIMADKMVPVVAAAAGTVYWQHAEQGGDCCAMGLRHDDGWVSYYIHLNNDTPGTDDGLGWGFADGIVVGAHVEAGQLIGWVGDSGNAENSGSHLHFELHHPTDGKLNPYPHLLGATVLEEPLPGNEMESTTCSWAEATILGTMEDDVIVGTPGDDVIMGYGGNDTIHGLGGRDIICGGSGSDVINGGVGNDILLGDGGDDRIVGKGGSDVIDGGSGNDTLLAGAGMDTVYGGAGDDTVFGGSDGDWIEGGDGHDRLNGRDGDDTILGGAGDDAIAGNAGDDPELDGGTGSDRVNGGIGNDVIRGGDGVDLLKGLPGNDIIDGGPDRDRLYGGGDSDTCIGEVLQGCEFYQDG